MENEGTTEATGTSRLMTSRIKHERERRAWTQSELAERLGTTQVNVSRWEKGKMPGPYYRQRLSEIFGKSLQELGLVPEAAQEHDLLSDASDHSSSDLPPPISNVPYRRNLLFTGREEILAHLSTALRRNKAEALMQAQAITGLGGIGKTQIAVEYAYRYGQDYQALLWVNASSRDALSSDFVTLAALLNLPEQHEQDQDIVVRAVKRWLTSHKGWLLVLDNVDSLGIIADFLPAGGAGDILITTRSQALGTIAQSIEVEKMDLEEGVKLLLRRTKVLAPGISLDQVSQESRTQTNEIVAALDGLPLALDQAGAYIEETQCGLSRYLDLYQTRRKELLMRRGSFPADHPESLAATWSLSLQEVEEENPAAVDLLRLLAFLSPIAIPEEIITQGAIELGPLLAPVVNDPLKLNDVIALLLRYSLIRRNVKTKSLSIHRLVQDVLKDDMEWETQRLWAERTIRAVHRAFPDVEIETWERCQRLLPHVYLCVPYVDTYDLAFPEAAHLFNEAAAYVMVHAQYQQVEVLLQKAREIRLRVLGDDHTDMARTLNDLGLLYLNQGRYLEAESILQQALTIRRRAFGEEHLDVVQTLRGLGHLYRHKGEYRQAKPYYTRALQIRKDILGTSHLLVAQSYYDLAKLSNSLGQYKEAEQFCELALCIREQQLGKIHPVVASTLNILAKIYQGQKKLDLAEAINKRALVMRESISGADHPNVATILNNLAEIYHIEGRYYEAESLIDRAFRIQAQTLGMEHPYLAYSLSNKAENFFLQGDYKKAESYYQMALAIREKHLGLNHPHTASTYFHLGKLYSASERYEEAEVLYRKALAIRESTFGLDHPTAASILQNLAILLRRLRRELEADEIEKRFQTIKSEFDAS